MLILLATNKCSPRHNISKAYQKTVRWLRINHLTPLIAPPKRTNSLAHSSLRPGTFPIPEVDRNLKIYHPLTSFLSNPFNVDTEEDVILHSTIHLVLPLMHLLQSTHPELTFNVKTEKTLPLHIRLQSGQIKKTFARQDLVLEASRNGSWRKHIVLIIEYKSSGTLQRNDWLNNIDDIGGGTLVGNGRLIGLQNREYLTSSSFPIVATYDGSALTGIRAKFRDRLNWGTGRPMKVEIFFEDRREFFVKRLPALTTMVLVHHGLV